MKKLIGLIAFVSLFLAGCSKVEKEWVIDALADELKKCSGTVEDLTLVKEGFFSNKFTGFATVKVAGETYYPDVTVYDDGEESFYTNQNACALADAQSAVEEFEQDARDLERQLRMLGEY